MKKIIIAFATILMFGMCVSCSCANNKTNEEAAVEAVDSTVVASPADTSAVDVVVAEPEDAADVAQE